MRSNRSPPFIATGPMPDSVNSPKSFQRSTVTTVHSVGTSVESSVAFHGLEFLPEYYGRSGLSAGGQLPLSANSNIRPVAPADFQAKRR